MKKVTYNIIVLETEDIIDGEFDTIEGAQKALTDTVTTYNNYSTQYKFEYPSHFAIQKITRKTLK